jgi:Leucine-rich repeat (LRR) protein
MRKHKQVGISAFLADRSPTTTNILSLPDRNITTIDEINPYLASEVESLDLRANRLASLKGIEQFSCLRELDVSENRLQKCEELARLRQLPQLKKLYLGNNPFLNEPIPEAILELILDKDTDIEILSFEVLSTLKDVEEREIKIIFLKNYIQKLGMHSELRSKGGVKYQKSPMEGEEVLDKLVPQFYTLI